MYRNKRQHIILYDIYSYIYTFTKSDTHLTLILSFTVKIVMYATR